MWPIHVPVLMPQVLEALSPRPGAHYLDGTLGLGGHAKAVLKNAADSQICGLDRDGEALEIARRELADFGDRIHFFQLPFSQFSIALERLGWKGIDGAFLDLGVSSLQLDRAERGFSFRQDGPLDMRMNQAEGISAMELVNRATHDELATCIGTYGEDPQAGRIARKIIEARQKQKIYSTSGLATIVASAYPAAWRRSARNHPATRTFQAIRMLVNDELEELKKFLDSILHWLLPGGRLVIISFHSLEDRIVKHAMRAWAAKRDAEGNERQPLVHIIYKKPLRPDAEEVATNPRAASAKLRAAIKLN